MSLTRGKKVLFTVLAVVLLAVLASQFPGVRTSAEPMTKAEAKELVKSRYNGEIVEINTSRDMYHITIKLDTGTYNIQIDRSKGEVQKVARLTEETAPQEKTEGEIREIALKEEPGEITKLEKGSEGEREVYHVVVQTDTSSTEMMIDPYSGEIIKSDTAERTTTQPITEEEAVQIALKQVKGKVDDVDLKDSDGQIYYLVDIEVNDDVDATVQIHAITGEVMTLTWDD